MDAVTRSLDEIGKSLDEHLVHGAKEWIAAGNDLLEAKGKIDHGEWIPWLENRGLSRQSAYNLMKVAETFSNVPRAVHLARRTLELLASPSTPKVIREEILDRAEAGEHITRDVVKERIEEFKQEPPKERKKPDLSNWHSCSTNPVLLPTSLQESRINHAMGSLLGLSYGDLQVMIQRIQTEEPKLWNWIKKLVDKNSRTVQP